MIHSLQTMFCNGKDSERVQTQADDRGRQPGAKIDVAIHPYHLRGVKDVDMVIAKLTNATYLLLSRSIVSVSTYNKVSVLIHIPSVKFTCKPGKLP